MVMSNGPGEEIDALTFPIPGYALGDDDRSSSMGGAEPLFGMSQTGREEMLRSSMYLSCEFDVDACRHIYCMLHAPDGFMYCSNSLLARCPQTIQGHVNFAVADRPSGSSAWSLLVDFIRASERRVHPGRRTDISDQGLLHFNKQDELLQEIV